MNIKKISFIFIFSCFIKSLFCMPAQPNYGPMPPPPSAEEIEEIMKSPEFKKMMGELEKIFEDIDEGDLQPPEKPREKATSTAKPEIPSKPKSIEQNFLEAAQPVSTKDKGVQLVKKLSQEKIEAFNYFINRFTKSINNIEKRINSFELGIAFKEYMENISLNKSINEINVAINQIKSKKLYQKVFFLPTNTQLRKEIIDSLKTSEKLEKAIKEKETEESEKEAIDFLQKIAGAEKKVAKIELNPLQKKLENLFNINLKNIDKKITSVAINTQAKEEIEKKKKLREKLEKDVEQKQKLAARRRTLPYRPAYQPGQRWPGYGVGKESYSGPKSWYNNYSRAYTPRRHTPTAKPTTPKTSPQETTKSAGGLGKPSEKLAEKLTLIKNIGNENIKLLKEVKEKYNAQDEQKSLKRIYKSKLLSTIANNFKKLEETKFTLTEEQKKRTENEKLKSAIINFMPLGIKLAKNPDLIDQQEAAEEIIKRQPAAMKTQLQKYESEIFKQLEGKENLLSTFSTSAQDIESIWRNLVILDTWPRENTKKIKEINEAFKKEYKTAKTNWENIPENLLEQLSEITENVGEQEVQLRGMEPQVGAAVVGGAQAVAGQQQNLSTGTGLNTVIDQLQVEIPDAIKKLLTEKITVIVPQNDMESPLKEEQKKKIREAFTQDIKNITAQQKFLPAIQKFFEDLEAD